MKQLQQLPRWVNWDAAQKNKAPKMPNGSFASSTNPQTWSSFEDVLASSLGGIGFVLSDTDNIIFIDLDHVLNEDKDFKDSCGWAKELVENINSYWEVSPSGDGLHGFVRGTLPDNLRNKVYFGTSILEVYDSGRYSTITTDLFTDNTIVSEVNLDLLISHLQKQEPLKNNIQIQQLTAHQSSTLSDDEVIQRMNAEGHWLTGMGQDGNSELDAALISHLSFWCGGDAAQIERIALTNPLKRDKWDRKQSGGTFLQYAIKSWNNSGKAEYYHKPEHPIIDIPFGDVCSVADMKKIVKEERKESKKINKDIRSEKKSAEISKIMNEWLEENSASTWFDIKTEKYCIKTADGIKYFSKNGFQQFFLSSCGIQVKSNEINIEAIDSDYRPDLSEFFNDSGKRLINTFMETELMSSKIKLFEIPKNINLLLNSLFDDKEQLEHFINWLAYIYQYRQRSGVAWVFAGTQGTGKGILADYIIKGIWKHNAVCNLTDSHLESAFNPYMQDKMFVHFNEISADNKKSRTVVKNRLKTWITDETIFINSKGVKEVEKSNYCNVIMSSNEHIPIDIEVNDRRFNVVRTNNILNKTDWFVNRETVEHIKDELKDFTYYLNGYSVNIKDARTVRNSAIKDDLIEAIKSIPELIYNAFVNRDFEFFIDCDLEDYLHSLNEFDKPTIDELQAHFKESFVSNKTICIMASAVFKKKLDSRTIASLIFKKFNFGEKFSNGYSRGWIF